MLTDDAALDRAKRWRQKADTFRDNAARALTHRGWSNMIDLASGADDKADAIMAAMKDEGHA